MSGQHQVHQEPADADLREAGKVLRRGVRPLRERRGKKRDLGLRSWHDG